MTGGKKAFERIGSVSERITELVRPLLRRFFARLVPPDGDHSDWSADADQARIRQEPLRARLLLRSLVVVVALLLVWAGVAEIDEVTRGEAKVVPSSQVQIIQTVDGGVVAEMPVREGGIVQPGELLLRVDPTRFVSSLAENRARYFALRAKAERLQALTSGAPLALSEDVTREVPEIAAHERRLYESSVAELDAQVSIARQQLAQRQQELNEVRARHEQASRGHALASKELEVTRPLLHSGAVSEVDILRLERDVSRLQGERDQSAAQIARTRSAVAEAQRKVQEVELNVRNERRAELSETMAQLGELSESSRTLADRVKHAEVRSPVRGTVKRLLVTTVGGVVQPGHAVAEIVPLDDALILEARVKPADIGFLRPGQSALVKFTAYDFAVYGGLEATVEQIGADTVTDDQGNAFYTVRVRTLEPQLGENLPVIPGMVAEIDILTGKKTILSYLLKPVLRARANAMSER